MNKKLLASGLIIVLLLASFPLWQSIDLHFFRWANSLLSSNGAKTFWALGNHDLTDFVEDFIFLGFYLAGLFTIPKKDRRLRLMQYILCIVLTALTIILINRVLCRDILHLKRESPSYVLDDGIRLTDVKVNSTKSFPGDHATTVLMFALSYAYYSGWRLGLPAILYALLRCMPRLVVGAHWLSDVAIGSGCIVLFSMSLLAFTPLGQRLPLWLASKRRAH